MTASESSLDQFVRAEYPRVVAAVGLITGDRSHAADAVQDAILRFLTRPSDVEPRNLAAWITVVASNRARDLRRSRGAESRAYQRLGVAEAIHPDPAAMRSMDVMRALRQLPQRQQQICVLHYFADVSVESIAASMGLSEGTVKTHLHRARRSLAGILSPGISERAGTNGWARGTVQV
jgi:RNA polymerase sigma-70 factor, ECF subfamily